MRYSKHRTDPGLASRRAITGPMLFAFILGDVLGAGIYALMGVLSEQVGGMLWAPFATLAETVGIASCIGLLTQQRGIESEAEAPARTELYTPGGCSSTRSETPAGRLSVSRPDERMQIMSNLDERSGESKMKALIVTCTLKPSPAESSSELLGSQMSAFLTDHDVDCESVRAVDHVIIPGVQKNMGEGDEWPALREKVLSSDILVFASPTWLGQHSSVAQRVLERLDAELSETDAEGRPILFDKVAVAAVVGNEDGAHHITAVLFQALNDVGFTVPAQGSVYWNGEAMHKTDYKDLEQTPKKVTASITTSLTNAIHLAERLRETGYPAS